MCIMCVRVCVCVPVFVCVLSERESEEGKRVVEQEKVCFCCEKEEGRAGERERGGGREEERGRRRGKRKVCVFVRVCAEGEEEKGRECTFVCCETVCVVREK